MASITSPGSKPSAAPAAPTIGGGSGPKNGGTAVVSKSDDVAGIPGSEADGGSRTKLCANALADENTMASASTLTHKTTARFMEPPVYVSSLRIGRSEELGFQGGDGPMSDPQDWNGGEDEEDEWPPRRRKDKKRNYN